MMFHSTYYHIINRKLVHYEYQGQNIFEDTMVIVMKKLATKKLMKRNEND